MQDDSCRLALELSNALLNNTKKGILSSSSAGYSISYAEFWIWIDMAFGIMRDLGAYQRMTVLEKKYLRTYK